MFKNHILSDEITLLIPEAEIHHTLEKGNIQNISKAKHFIELENNQKIILFKIFPKGKTLFEKVQKISERFTEQDAISLIITLAEIVQKYQKLEIVNRDINPSNIWITDNNEVILFDFDQATNLNQLNISKANIEEYLPPTYFGNLKSSTPSKKEDIYSLGIILAYILAGSKTIKNFYTRFPIGKNDEDGEQIVLYPKRILKELKDPSFNLSSNLLTILEKSINDWKTEYSDVNELILDLKKLQQDSSYNLPFSNKLISLST